MWVDISKDSLLERNRDDQAPPLERRATTKIPSVRNKFNELLESQVHSHNLQTKMNELFTTAAASKNLTRDEEKTYELIEERMRRGIKKADNKCRKVRRGQIPFSLTAQEIMRKLRMLKLIQLRQRMIGKENRPKMTKMRRLARKYNYQGPLSYASSDQIDEALKKAKQKYSKFRPRAIELRENYLYNIASERSEEDQRGRNVDWHHNKLIAEEKIKNHFNLI